MIALETLIAYLEAKKALYEKYIPSSDGREEARVVLLGIIIDGLKKGRIK